MVMKISITTSSTRADTLLISPFNASELKNFFLVCLKKFLKKFVKQ